MNLQKIIQYSIRKVILISINVLVFLFFLEVGSLGFYWITKGKFFYTRGEKTEAEASQENEVRGILLDEKASIEKLQFDESVIVRLHPFFGFIYLPNMQHPGNNVNNEGFISPFDYPLNQKTNQFFVGITGGSVAVNIAIHEHYYQIIKNKIKQIPRFKDKEIIFINMALGGYKQPQQLLILNYFLARDRHFDLVINIDGFNEVALSNINNRGQVDLAMPSLQHIAPLVNLANNQLSTEEMRSMVKLEYHKQELKSQLQQLENCRLASCYALKSISTKYHFNRYQTEVSNLDRFMLDLPELTIEKIGDLVGDPSLVHINRNPPLEDAQAFAEITDLWANSSLLIHQLLSSRGIPYFHFIQPNQYYPTDRVFSTEEKQIALLENHPYLEGVQQGYPKAIAKIESLQQSQVNIFDATQIFDRETEIVYADACCHYTDRGNEIFSNYIADAIVRVLTEKETPTQSTN